LAVRRHGYLVRQAVGSNVSSRCLDKNALPDILPGGPDGQRITLRLPGLLPPPLDPRLLHLEEIRKICLNVDGDQAFGRLHRVIADGNLLLDAGANFAQPFHDQGAVRIAICSGDATGEQCPVGFLRLRSQRLEGKAVHGQAPAGQDTGIKVEDAMRMFGMDVSVGQGDAEG
jgi:hypothetical protein